MGQGSLEKTERDLTMAEAAMNAKTSDISNLEKALCCTCARAIEAKVWMVSERCKLIEICWGMLEPTEGS